MQFIYCNTNLKHTGNNNLNVVTWVLQSQRQKASFILARFRVRSRKSSAHHFRQ